MEEGNDARCSKVEGRPRLVAVNLAIEGNLVQVTRPTIGTTMNIKESNRKPFDADSLQPVGTSIEAQPSQAC